MDKLRLIQAIRQAIATINGLADQQAMPDSFYLPTLSELNGILVELEKD